MYDIKFSESVVDDLKNIDVFHRRAVLAAIENHLSYEPSQPSRRRKILVNVSPSFETVPPIWQLRVGSYRVFYDIDDEWSTVNVRAVRFKPAHKTTGDII